jgi:hypothetical protein
MYVITYITELKMSRGNVQALKRDIESDLKNFYKDKSNARDECKILLQKGSKRFLRVKGHEMGKNCEDYKQTMMVERLRKRLQGKKQ